MIETPELLLRLALGALYGGLIGYERQVHGRPAGFRTHILVCAATVLLMEVSIYYHHLSYQDPSYIRIDPARIAAGAITGIGFLGAGVIIKLGASVQGLTTAASIWMAAAIGMGLGGGMYSASFAALLITLFSLSALGIVEKKIPSHVFKILSITAAHDTDEEVLRTIITNFGVSISRADYEKDMTHDEYVLRYTLSIKGKTREALRLKPLVDEISSIQGIKKVTIRVI